MTAKCNQGKYSIFKYIPSFILYILYHVCCVRVVCSSAVVAFKLHCFGSDFKALEMELVHFMLSL